MGAHTDLVHREPQPAATRTSTRRAACPALVHGREGTAALASYSPAAVACTPGRPGSQPWAECPAMLTRLLGGCCALPEAAKGQCSMERPQGLGENAAELGGSPAVAAGGHLLSHHTQCPLASPLAWHAKDEEKGHWARGHPRPHQPAGCSWPHSFCPGTTKPRPKPCVLALAQPQPRLAQHPHPQHHPDSRGTLLQQRPPAHLAPKSGRRGGARHPTPRLLPAQQVPRTHHVRSLLLASQLLQGL